MTDRPQENNPVTVRDAKRRGDVQQEWCFSAKDRWRWAEPAVWTERMLEALEKGVKGGRWHSLIDKVYSPKNLRAAFARVKRNKGGAGVDHVSIKAFEGQLDTNIEKLHEGLKAGTYRPQAIKRCWIPKAGKRELRPLGVPTVRDRVVQTAIRSALEPIFEKHFAEHSYGFRPQRGCRDALRRVDTLLKQGYHYVVDADIKGYFDNIPHGRLMKLVKTQVADGRVLSLIESFLEQEILEDLARWTPEDGTPQGAVISPLLSNIYLNPLDHLMAGKGIEMVRYADDFIVFCRDAASAQAALAHIQEWMDASGLALHPEKTHIVDYGGGEGFDFLGYRFKQGKHWPSRKSMKKIRANIRAKTTRTNGHSLECIIETLNPTLRGWFGYFKHTDKWVLREVDGYVRMRLRSILRKRSKRKGRAKGADNHRWPNAYFATRGLYALEHAYEQTIQSSRR